MKKFFSILMLLLSFSAFSQAITIINNTPCTYEFSFEGTHVPGNCTTAFLGLEYAQPFKTQYFKVPDLIHIGGYIPGSPVEWLNFELNAGCNRSTFFDAPCNTGVYNGPTSPQLNIAPVSVPNGNTCTCSAGPLTVDLDYQPSGDVIVTIN